jgi:hypothetical protein
MPKRRRLAPICLRVMLAVVLLCGCRSRPKAPALIDERVFQSDEGFRFLVPEGWRMTARGNVPPGPLDKERLLVQYRWSSEGYQALLEVSLADLPSDADLRAYLSGPSFSASRWEPSGDSEPLTISGVDGARSRFTARVNGNPLEKEVTGFRRGERVYFFTLLFAPQDAASPEQVQRAIGQLVWTK